MKRILVVDSSSEVQIEVRRTMGTRFDLVFASTFAEARSAVAKDLFDLILIEASLSDGDGYTFCNLLKKQEITGDIPVIFLSGKSLVEEKLQAFQSGADDYVVKPFEPAELLARAEVRLRKFRGNLEQESVIQKGDLTLSVPYQKAILKEAEQDKDLRLTPTEFRLLYFFIKNEGEVLSRSQLLATIWSDEVHVLTRTIDKHISTLKKKLASRASYIQSIHSRGYRFSTSKAPTREQAVGAPIVSPEL